MLRNLVLIHFLSHFDFFIKFLKVRVLTFGTLGRFNVLTALECQCINSKIEAIKFFHFTIKIKILNEK